MCPPADDPVLDPARGRPSRRTLVRGATHAAWMAPLVSVATAAPAAAATSGAPTMQITSANFWSYTWLSGWVGFVPVIALTNPTQSALTSVWVNLYFSIPRFLGVLVDPNGGPRLPSVSVLDAPADAPDGEMPDGWSVSLYRGFEGVTTVVATLSKASLAPGATTLIGDPSRVTGLQLTWSKFFGTEPLGFVAGSAEIAGIQGQLNPLGTVYEPNRTPPG